MRIALSLLLLITLTGCIHPKVVSYEAVQGTARRHAEDTVYYCGTKEGYDYFFVESGDVFSLNQGKYYRVLTEDSPVKDRFYFTKDQSRWERSMGFHAPTGGRQIFVPAR
ncbi:hypothetical protein [Pedosphaera parvula]|uniref:Lipoprotein n=1 Tax=Pedosphaera parvula (strain Ellin514) TaxID=320771 RepID=B9XEX8_PEDPL|nr:hypothetical protein [Pedosphaera parvula]EEF61476.1 hypothetical protein Cflav_PD4154 [Pedosphaera parvula Ellin514]